MKFYVLLISLFLFRGEIQSQTYVAIPFDTIHYWLESVNAVFPENCSATIQLKTLKNKTFNGKTYHLVGEFGASVTNSTTNSCYLNTITSGLVRQDTLQRKVWLLNDTNSFNETLLYDFSLNIGDTAKYLCPGCPNYPIVSSISYSVYGDGISHKVISHTIVPGFNAVYEDVIEGIGSKTGFFETSHSIPYFRQLTCFGKIFSYPNNIQSIYSNNNCNISTHISTTNKKTQLKIYPNPVQMMLILNYMGFENEKRESIEIVNSLGLKMECSITNDITTKVNTANLPAGIYFLKVYFQSGNYIIQPFVKD